MPNFDMLQMEAAHLSPEWRSFIAYVRECRAKGVAPQMAVEIQLPVPKPRQWRWFGWFRPGNG